MYKRQCIFGNSGFAKEVSQWIPKLGYQIDAFIDRPENTNHTLGVYDDSYFNPTLHVAVVAIGNPALRKKIVDSIIAKHGDDVFTTIIHPSAIIDDADVGKGVVICAGCILTCNIKVGDFSQLNLSTTIGHDTVLGEYFTTAPGAHINGHVTTGTNVYFGSNSSTVESLNICSDVIVGAGGCVVKDIIMPGTYVGVPVKKIT